MCARILSRQKGSAAERQIDRRCRYDGGGFYAQPRVAERHRLPATLEGEGHFGAGEIPFGADQYRDGRLALRASRKCLLDVDLAGGFVAVADELEAFVGLAEEVGDGRDFVELRDGALVRLLGGADQQALDALRLENLALGVVAEDGRDDIDADLRGLLGKPFETVDVLRRADGHAEPVVVAAVVLHPLVHVEEDGARIVVHDRAAVEHAVTVDHVDGVAAAVAQHPHAVARLVGVERPAAVGNRF